ncbi:dihydrolipoyl dehydrogenase 1, mitochondrial [Tanacetum coccineum]
MDISSSIPVTFVCNIGDMIKVYAAARDTNSALSYSTRLCFASGGGFDENDVVVISGGPGGYVAAIKEAQLGLKTT